MWFTIHIENIHLCQVIRLQKYIKNLKKVCYNSSDLGDKYANC